MYALLAVASLAPAVLHPARVVRSPPTSSSGLFAVSLARAGGVHPVAARRACRSTGSSTRWCRTRGCRAGSARGSCTTCASPRSTRRRRHVPEVVPAAVLRRRGSDAVYQFWNRIVERAQDEPEAVTPLAEAIYTCASPLAVTYVIAAAAARSGDGVSEPAVLGRARRSSRRTTSRGCCCCAATGRRGRSCARRCSRTSCCSCSTC